jgi:hypothetical protein
MVQRRLGARTMQRWQCILNGPLSLPTSARWGSTVAISVCCAISASWICSLLPPQRACLPGGRLYVTRAFPG